MKAITLWQPWASLLACGAKKYETRSWDTKYRGPIAIHAAIKPALHCLCDCETPLIRTMAEALGCLPEQSIFDVINSLPCGCIIATAELVGCHKMVLHGGRGLSSASPGWLETDSGIYMPTKQELIFGDWTPGRYAWEFRNVTILPEPVPVKGKQGIWTWESTDCLEPALAAPKAGI